MPPLLLLHGTGGNEDDLMPLGEALLPGAARLSPRGQVLENGAPRFFRRLAEGVFDLDDLKTRTHQLADFVENGRAGRTSLPDRRSRSASRTAPTSPPRCSCCGRECSAAPSCSGRWCRSFPNRCPRSPGCRWRSSPGAPIRSCGRSRARIWPTFSARPGREVELSWIAGGHGLTREDLEIGRRWLSKQ